MASKKHTKTTKKKSEDLHWRLRPGEHDRFLAAADMSHADNLTSWARHVLHAECDRLGIPRIKQD